MSSHCCCFAENPRQAEKKPPDKKKSRSHHAASIRFESVWPLSNLEGGREEFVVAFLGEKNDNKASSLWIDVEHTVVVVHVSERSVIDLSSGSGRRSRQADPL
ncbi:MAG: hypothetical protein Q8P67_07830 [archaeon]|nr:hypothetical protein [archaeon]